jgi:biotin transport system substrate-specific component
MVNIVYDYQEVLSMKSHISTRELILTGLFCALTAVGAFIRIPLGYSSFTLQVFFVFMAGVILGPKYGFLSQLTYILLGLLGLPIFTGGGGISYIFQPTFGFLLGYLPGAWIVGKIAGGSVRVSRILTGCLAGLAVIYLIGLPYMAWVLNVYMGYSKSAWEILWSGMILFLPYDALKIAATIILSKELVPAVKRMESVSMS